jgi:hypothetical protein
VKMPVERGEWVNQRALKDTNRLTSSFFSMSTTPIEPENISISLRNRMN